MGPMPGIRKYSHRVAIRMKLKIAMLAGILLWPATFIFGQAPTIVSDSCGITLRDLSDSLFIEPVTDAQQYYVRFIDITNSPARTELPALPVIGVRYFSPAAVQKIQYDRIYEVLIDAKTPAGLITGRPCILYTPAFPHSRIANNMCGVTLKLLSDQLIVQQVPAATDYEFLIQDANGTILGADNPSHPTPYFYTPSWYQAIQYGKRYTFFVRAQVNGQWRAHYGPGCSVTMPPFPKTAIAKCPRVLSSLNEEVDAVPIAGATAYEFEVTDVNDSSKKATMKRDHANFWFFYLSGSHSPICLFKRVVLIWCASEAGGRKWRALGAMVAKSRHR